jgi:hypothetical protein
MERGGGRADGREFEKGEEGSFMGNVEKYDHHSH